MWSLACISRTTGLQINYSHFLGIFFHLFNTHSCLFYACFVPFYSFVGLACLANSLDLHILFVSSHRGPIFSKCVRITCVFVSFIRSFWLIYPSFIITNEGTMNKFMKIVSYVVKKGCFWWEKVQKNLVLEEENQWKDETKRRTCKKLRR